MLDNMSSISQRAASVAISRFLIQSIFLFMLASLSAAAIIFEWGNINLWTMFLVICVSQMLNLPVIELATILCESFKSPPPSENLSHIP